MFAEFDYEKLPIVRVTFNGRIQNASEFDDFINQQGVEYNRIYDKAIVDITSKLLILLNK